MPSPRPHVSRHSSCSSQTFIHQASLHHSSSPPSRTRAHARPTCPLPVVKLVFMASKDKRATTKGRTAQGLIGRTATPAAPPNPSHLLPGTGTQTCDSSRRARPAYLHPVWTSVVEKSGVHIRAEECGGKNVGLGRRVFYQVGDQPDGQHNRVDAGVGASGFRSGCESRHLARGPA